MSCTHGSKGPVPGEVAQGSSVEAAPPSKAGGPTPTPPLGEDPCVVLDQLPHEPPLFLADLSVVVTRLVKSCVTRDGRRGYDKATPWMAMGFPCTGGDGLIDWKGTNYQRPKMVAFILGTDCAVEPAHPKSVSASVKQKLQLPAGANLLAYNPFVVQFWEIPGLAEADTGFTIEMRSDVSLDKPWARLLKNESMRVRLYGRENAWVQGNHIYAVEADLVVTERNRFKIKVVDVRTLKVDEIEAVKTRCEALRPRRNCQQVF